MRRQAGIQVAGACDELENEEGSDRPCLAGRDVCRDCGARASRAFASLRSCSTIKVTDSDSAPGRAGPEVPRATGLGRQPWPHRKRECARKRLDFAPDRRGKQQRNRGLATTWARVCSNCELWTRDRAHFIHCNRSRGHYRQQGVRRHYRGRSLGVAERGHFERGPGAVHTPHRQAVRTGRRARRVHQYRRAYRAAGWDGRHPGGHRRPQ